MAIATLLLPSAGGAQSGIDTLDLAPLVVAPTPDSVPLTLSLREAIEGALGRNPAVLRARARVSELEAQVRATRAQGRPQINTQIFYIRVFRSVFLNQRVPTIPDSAELSPWAANRDGLTTALRTDGDPTPGSTLQQLPIGGDTTTGVFPIFSTINPFKNTWFAGITISQLLYSGGQVAARVDAARRLAEAGRLNLLDTEGEVALAVKRAYYDAVLAEEMIAIARADLRQAEAQLALVQTRLTEGTASELDLLRAEVERENLTPQVTEAENTRSTTRLDLRSLVRLPLDRELILTTGLCPAPPISERPDHLPAPVVADSAIDHRPAVLAAAEELEARAAELRSARAAFRPTLSLTANFGWQAFPGALFPGADEWSADWFATLNFQFPIYLGGSLRANRDAARARAVQAEADRVQERETARQDYRKAVERLDRAWAQVETRRRTVLAAEEIYRLNQLRYQEGVAIQLEVLDAATALSQARTNMVRGYYDYFTALGEAERALGQPVEAMVLPTAPCHPLR
jgi:outer membrane protein TolC